MKISKNPGEEKIKEYCNLSKYAAAKWLKDMESGDVFAWPAGSEQHAAVAAALGIEKYEKGLFTADQE